MKEKSCFTSIILQICQGIKLLNSNGFIHCDLKLENIMITYDPKINEIPIVKIIDFGSTFEYKHGLPKIVQIFSH